MKIRAKLTGGLANQMFIAASAIALSTKLGEDFELDATTYQNPNEIRKVEVTAFSKLKDKIVFDNPRSGLVSKFTNSRAQNVRALPIFKENGFAFDDQFLAINQPVQLEGYFQSPRYFEPDVDTVRTYFEYTDENPAMLAIHDKVGSDYMAIHVRLGDYLSPQTRSFHGVCDSNYFVRSLNLLRELNGNNLPVVCFTDTLEALDSKIANLVDYIVDPSLGQSHHHLLALSSAQHLVISNSSFSWWAAYLSDKPFRRIIAPRPWFKQGDVAASDLILPEWISLGNFDWQNG